MCFATALFGLCESSYPLYLFINFLILPLDILRDCHCITANVIRCHLTSLEILQLCSKLSKVIFLMFLSFHPPLTFKSVYVVFRYLTTRVCCVMGFPSPKASQNHEPQHHKVQSCFIRGRGAGHLGPMFQLLSLVFTVAASVKSRPQESFLSSEWALRKSALMENKKLQVLLKTRGCQKQPASSSAGHVLSDVWSQ